MYNRIGGLSTPTVARSHPIFLQLVQWAPSQIALALSLISMAINKHIAAPRSTTTPPHNDTRHNVRPSNQEDPTPYLTAFTTAQQNDVQELHSTITRGRTFITQSIAHLESKKFTESNLNT